MVLCIQQFLYKSYTSTNSNIFLKYKMCLNYSKTKRYNKSIIVNRKKTREIFKIIPNTRISTHSTSRFINFAINYLTLLMVLITFSPNFGSTSSFFFSTTCLCAFNIICYATSIKSSKTVCVLNIINFIAVLINISEVKNNNC